MVNARQLALRDPARAALMGAIGGSNGHNFGFGDDYGFGGQFGDDSYSANYGDDDYGFGATKRKPHPAAHRPLPQSTTQDRTLLLDPNRNSTVKVQRYSFSLTAATVTIGTAVTIASFSNQPSTSVKPQRVLTNAPAPGFWYITLLQVANVNVLVGGTEDAFTYSPLAQNVMLDLPRVDPQNKVSSAGSYSGSIPSGFSSGLVFTPILTLQGPSVLAGGYGQ